MSHSSSRKQDQALAELFIGEPGAMRLDPVAPPSTRRIRPAFNSLL